MSYDLKVPKGTGTIYGNLIRQIAICGVYNWRPIAYYLGTKDNSLGLMGNNHFNTLHVLQSKLEVLKKPPIFEMCILEKFTLNKNKYISEHFSLEFPKPLNCSHLEAYFLYANGTRSLEENAAYLSTFVDITNYICVSSRHSETSTIKYKIDDLDNKYETISFENVDDLSTIISIIKDTINSF